MEKNFFAFLTFVSLVCCNQTRNPNLIQKSNDTFSNNSINEKNSTKDSFVKLISGHMYYLRYAIGIKNNQIATIGDDLIRIWDSESGLLKKSINNFGNRLSSILVLNNGNIAVSGIMDFSVTIWNTSNGRLIKNLTGHSDGVLSLCITQNDYLISGSYDTTVKIWNPNEGTLIRTLKGHTSPVRALIALSNSRVVSGSNDRTFKIWNIDNGELIQSVNTKKMVKSFSLLGDDLVVGCTDDENSFIQTWSLKDDKINKKIENEFTRIKSFLSYKDNLIISTFHNFSSDKIQIWNPTKKQIITKINSIVTSSLDYLSHSRLIVTSTDRKIYIFDLNSWSLIRKISAHTKPIKSLDVLPNGNILTGSDDEKIIIWNYDQESTVKIIDSFSKISALGIFKIGNFISGSKDGKIKIWNSTDGKLIKSMNPNRNAIKNLLVINNNLIASVSIQAEDIYLWDIDKGSLIKTLEGHKDIVSSLAILPDGSIVSGSHDKLIKIWNQKGLLLKTLSGHKDSVNTVQVFKDGRIASGSSDGTIKIWDAKSGTMIKSLDLKREIFTLGILSNDNFVLFNYNNIDLIDSKSGLLIKKMFPKMYMNFDGLNQDCEMKIFNDKIIISMENSIQIFDPIDL